jgi:hypothetical protein
MSLSMRKGPRQMQSYDHGVACTLHVCIVTPCSGRSVRRDTLHVEPTEAHRNICTRPFLQRKIYAPFIPNSIRSRIYEHTTCLGEPYGWIVEQGSYFWSQHDQSPQRDHMCANLAWYEPANLLNSSATIIDNDLW